MRRFLLFAWAFSVSLAGYCQAAPPAPTPSSSRPAPRVNFHSDLLDLSFKYPESLVSQPLPSLEEQHKAIAARQPANAKPEDRKTDECSDKALLAVRGDESDKPQGNATIDGDKPGTGVNPLPHAVTAKIVISRIGVKCMPAAYQEQLDNVATAMSAGLAQDKDLRPVDRPIWYDINSTRIHFAASESALTGSQAGTGPDPKSKSRWVGSAAFVWEDNLVSIVIESNNLAFFNSMLHGEIILGKNKPAELFPADIGTGKPIEIKP